MGRYGIAFMESLCFPVPVLTCLVQKTCHSSAVVEMKFCHNIRQVVWELMNCVSPDTKK